MGLLLSSPVYGSFVMPRVKQLSIDQGISNSRITAVFQDSRGFLWVGTKDGLNRYDGYGFLEYKHDPLDSLSIPGSYIQTIIETSDGNIWIGTKYNGIAIWERRTNNFRSLRSLLGDKNKISESDIYGMSQKDGYVWVITPNYLVKISEDLTEVSEYSHYNNYFKSGRYDSYPVIFRNEDEIWIGSKDGLLIFDVRKEVFSRFKVNGMYLTDDISSILFDNDSIVFIGCENSLKKINLSTNDLSIVWAEDSPAGYVSVNCLGKNSNDEIWIGTYRGIEISEYPFDYHSLFKKDSRHCETLNNIQVTSMLFDRSGILWVGTKSQGLFKVILSEPKFRSLSVDSELPVNLDTYDFTTLVVDKDGELWLGTEEDGVYRIDSDFKRVKHYSVNRSSEYDFEDKVNCILEGDNGNMWMGTDNGIFKINKYTGVLTEFDYAGSTEFSNLLRNNRINSMLKDRLGDIWIATNFGLYKYNKKKIVSYFTDDENQKDNFGLCSDVINVLHEDKEGWLWIGTKKGVNFVRRAGEQFNRLRNDEGKAIRISNNDIVSFGEGNDNVIWIGTRSGLSYYNKATNLSGLFDKSRELQQIMICDVLLDDFNRMWMGTNKGIFHVDAEERVFRYTVEDGLPGFTFNKRAAFKVKNRLYFGGIKGLAFLDVDSLQENMVIPNVVITGVDVLHKGKVIKRYRGEVSKIELKYNKNTIVKVDFAALEFTQPEHNWYKVKLENYDENWREANQKNSVSFSNLSPGDYQLKVLGANSDFVWNNIPTELNIHVVPPLWMTGFAYIFYILLGVLIIQFIINLSVRKYRIENKRLKEETDNKHRIEEQKEKLTKINRRLTDSISYAKRIQEAIIPAEQVFRTLISDAFIYYRPKDIVSGDFYWIYENEYRIFIAAVDCTGHGVPGAFMSIVGHGMLSNIVEIQGVICPAQALNLMNEEVVRIFKKNIVYNNDFNYEVKDGMDMALCMIDKRNSVMEFAGAINSMYLIRENEIFTFKGDRFSIGHSGGEKFRKEVVQLVKDDIIYLFSDGYADQFGGPENKKFKYRRFRHLLLNIHKLPMQDQKAILHQKMEEWINYNGNAQEQVDDILIIGLKPLS